MNKCKTDPITLPPKAIQRAPLSCLQALTLDPQVSELLSLTFVLCSFCLENKKKKENTGKRKLLPLILFLALERAQLFPVTQLRWLFQENFCCFFVESPVFQKCSSNAHIYKLNSDSRTVPRVLLSLFLFLNHYYMIQR